MSWRIDVLDSSGAVLGSGPITSATGWQSTTRMDRAGVFSFEMPASDSKASLLQPLRIVRCYATVNGAWVEIGAGVVERIETEIDDSGQAVLRVSGSDMLAELTTQSPLQVYIDGGFVPATATHAQAVAGLAGWAPGWTFTPDGTPPVNSLTGRWNYETTLQACVSLAAKCRNHFYATGFRTLAFASTWTASGVRAVQARGDLGAGTCAIAQLRAVEDGSEIITYLIPFGAGNADARLTMIPATATVPAGYTAPQVATWYRALTHTAATATYGTRVRVVQFKDVTPISSTDADVQAAANALMDQAVRYLSTRIAPQRFYSLAVSECPTVLRPLQTIRVVYRDVAQGISIDEDLLILEATTEVRADGPRTTGLLVATADRWPDSDSGAVVQRLTQAQLYEVAPQLNANSYVISYTKPVDDAETASFRFRFDSEVVQLTRLTFDFQLLPLESTVKSVAGTAQTTNSGGSSAPTSSSGGATTSSGGSSHTHTVNDHTHGVPNHQHNIQVTLGSTVTYPVGFGAAGTSGGLVSTVSGSTFNLPTNASSGATTSSSGGGQTSSSEGSHTHTIGNHTHTVTIAAHTHDYTPTITAAYGIFRDSAGNTFGLTDLEYSVNGTTWYAFTVGVNGFASLGDGWYRVDLTSLLQNSSTLRPTANNNAVQVRRKSTGAIKKAMIEAQINVRTIIQAIAAL